MENWLLISFELVLTDADVAVYYSKKNRPDHFHATHFRMLSQMLLINFFIWFSRKEH